MKTVEKKLAAIFGVVLIAVMVLSGTAYAITNGEPDAGRHPYVGLLVFDVYVPDVGNVPAWRCTGSLIAPDVVLCAGHCTDGAVAARIWFDEVVEENPEYPFSGTTSYDGIPYTYDDFCIGCGKKGLTDWITGDVGVVVLTEPVPTSVVSEYAALPAASLVDTFRNKQDVDLVGYGVQWQVHGDHGPPYWVGPKVRLTAPAQLIASNHVMSDEFMRLTANPGGGTGGTCYGDSGSPILLVGTNTVLGVCSWGTNYNCAGVSYEQRIDIPEILEWINSFLD